MNIAQLWYSTDAKDWEQALKKYWDYVQPRNRELEKVLNNLEINRIQRMNPDDWFGFLHDEYFRWKFTQPNRYATTIRSLCRYKKENDLTELDAIRVRLLSINTEDISGALLTAKRIHGLGVAGASGLLSLMYPCHFATVDQFIVKALASIDHLPEKIEISQMKPDQLRIKDGVLLVKILREKAKQNNSMLRSETWTPRKLDMVLWAARP